jgi:hypothetical protein
VKTYAVDANTSRTPEEVGRPQPKLAKRANYHHHRARENIAVLSRMSKRSLGKRMVWISRIHEGEGDPKVLRCQVYVSIVCFGNSHFLKKTYSPNWPKRLILLIIIRAAEGNRPPRGHIRIYLAT